MSSTTGLPTLCELAASPPSTAQSATATAERLPSGLQRAGELVLEVGGAMEAEHPALRRLGQVDMPWPARLELPGDCPLRCGDQRSRKVLAAGPRSVAGDRGATAPVLAVQGQVQLGEHVPQVAGMPPVLGEPFGAGTPESSRQIILITAEADCGGADRGERQRCRTSVAKDALDARCSCLRGCQSGAHFQRSPHHARHVNGHSVIAFDLFQIGHPAPDRGP